MKLQTALFAATLGSNFHSRLLDLLMEEKKKTLSELISAFTWRELIVAKLYTTREAIFLIVFILSSWTVSFFNILISHGELSKQGGIVPRKTVTPLFAILWSFLLHDSIATLILNTLFFVIVSVIMLNEGLVKYLILGGLVTLISGLVVWCIGFHDEIFFGLSSLILGYATFPLIISVFERDYSLAAIIAGSSVLLYISISLRGIIFWESAAVAVIVGAGYAYWDHLRGKLVEEGADIEKEAFIQ